ncbi:helix-turn-helix transcriptional regulator [Luteolibacter flavescens]|uniref:Helix-turn-helix transcriptional regulator n=1 Tax=Luteolibacter flavescens TaxID=1859460 RepID=A0ABT3FSG2_9BACT|nr:helix-turn-helix domain-containing protein [Luteolibacter flavescens]MCW1886176.1 helix-turn-helix transcriptional regulator [Luteolibacter flavescens]
MTPPADMPQDAPVRTAPAYLSLDDRNRYRSLEEVVGCKWAVAVVAAIARGVKRPGALERFIPGISAKVLAERLKKLLEHGLAERTEYPGLPARVEYDLSPRGQRLAGIIEQLRELDTHYAAGEEAAP